MKSFKAIMAVEAVFLLLLLLPTVSIAGPATETVKMHSDKVLAVLRDPALKPAPAKSAKKVKIRAISEQMFDFTELSKRTLAKNWNLFNPEQQNEFVKLYRSLLEDAYADKILAYTDEKIVYTKEVPLTEKTLEVQSTILRKNGEVPIYYRVILKNGAWKVYDVIIEGVSLTNNYRSQFKEMLMNKTPESLLETLRTKSGKS